MRDQNYRRIFSHFNAAIFKPKRQAWSIPWAGSQKDDWSLPVKRGSKPVFVKRDTGLTNDQQRHFSEWPISELHGKVDSIRIQTSLKLLLPSSNNGMSSRSFSSGQAETGFGWEKKSCAIVSFIIDFYRNGSTQLSLLNKVFNSVYSRNIWCKVQ